MTVLFKSRMDEVESYYAQMRTLAAKKFKSLDILSQEAVFNLVHSFNRVQNRLVELLQTSGLTLSGFNVLSLLNHNREKGLPLHQLSRLLLVSRANVTGLIDSLERKGLVKRTDHETDRRVYVARITPKGGALLKVHRPLYYQKIKRMTSFLSHVEKTELVRLLRKLREGVGENESKHQFHQSHEESRS